MKKLVSILLFALFALNSSLGVAGGVVLCMHKNLTHVELGASHCRDCQCISTDSDALTQKVEDHLGDIVLISDDSSNLPKIFVQNLLLASPVFIDLANSQWCVSIFIFEGDEAFSHFNCTAPPHLDSCANYIRFEKFII